MSPGRQKPNQMDNFQFTSYEEFKRHLGVEKIKWVKCAKREMGMVYGIKIFTSEKLDWNKETFVTEGEHGNLYVCNLKTNRESTER